MSFKDFVERLVSKQSSPQKINEEQKEKRRHNRIELEETEQIFVHLLKPDSAEVAHTIKARVSNVSLRGCRLHFEDDQSFGEVALHQQFTCSLSIDEFPIPLLIEVVRVVSPREAGIVFKAPFPRELEKLEKFIEPRCLGLSLREIKSEALQQSESKKMRWFQGINETHLFSWIDTTSGEIQQQQLVFLETVVEWKKGQPVRTGRIQPDASSVHSMGWVQSELLNFDAVANPEVLGRADQIVRVASIDQATKNFFLTKLKE